MVLKREKYHIKLISRFCGVTRPTVNKWVESGKLKAGDEGWVTPEEFMRFLDSHPKYRERVENYYEQKRAERRDELLSSVRTRERDIRYLEKEKEKLIEQIALLDAGDLEIFF